MQFSVNCFKPNYAVPRSDSDYCESLPEPKFENCQVACQGYSASSNWGDAKPCVQFTFHNKTNEMGDIEYECCLYTTLTSSLEYKNGTISGPKRCGMLFRLA